MTSMRFSMRSFLTTMLRKFLIVSMTLTLAWSTVACSVAGDPQVRTPQNQPTTEARAQTNLSDGEYPVQQATYDDTIGEYSLMLLNTKAGEPSVYHTTNLPMARLSDEQIQSGQKSNLKVEKGEPSLFLTEDFKIEYVHNVTETQQNPQTGQQEVVVVRRESNFWSPFAGALAGQALGSLLFRPTYYFPPVYQPGVVLTGFGGYGRSYDEAAGRYRSRYNAPPLEVRNRQAFRSTGQLRTPSASSRVKTASPFNRTVSTGSGVGSSNLRRSNRSTGSGVGSSNLRRSSPSTSSPKVRRSNRGFGSGFGSGSRSGGFSRGRRR